MQQGELPAEENNPECDAHSFEYPEPPTVSDIDSDDSGVDMGKFEGQCACELAVRRRLVRSSRSRRGAQLFGTTTVDSAAAHRRRRRPLLSMTPTKPSGGVCGITSNTLVRSSQRTFLGRCGGVPTAVGLSPSPSFSASPVRNPGLWRRSDCRRWPLSTALSPQKDGSTTEIREVRAEVQQTWVKRQKWRRGYSSESLHILCIRH